MMPNLSPPRCPSCGAERIAHIQYGLVFPDEEHRRKLAAGEVVMGGCVVTGAAHVWQCTACGHQWGGRRPQLDDVHDA
jgi:hypothetical protein